MFDIHYHLLYGLDDGPKTLQDSLALAAASLAESVTHIVATPHCNYRYEFNPELNRERVAELEEILQGRLTIGLGCDLHLSYDNVEDAIANPSKYSINGGRYVLVEFADSGIPEQMSEALFRMRLAGLIPIITHPERNPILLSEPARMLGWIHEGCLVQVTAASIAGRFGPRAESAANKWIEAGWVHIIASDAHSVEWRGPSMASAYSEVEECCGKETADRLCIENPRAAFFNEEMPPQPDPIEIEFEGPRKRGLLSRLFGR